MMYRTYIIIGNVLTDMIDDNRALVREANTSTISCTSILLLSVCGSVVYKSVQWVITPSQAR